MSNGGDVPNPETGVGIGAGEGSTFEPEEDAGTAGGEVVEPTAQPAAGGDEGGSAAQGDGAPDSH